MDLHSCQLKVFSYNRDSLFSFLKEIRRISELHFLKCTGNINLPLQIKRYTVLRSPHIDKKSREQFEMRTYSRSVVISRENDFTYSSDVFENFVKDIVNREYHGISYDVKLFYKSRIYRDRVE
uniref:Ribosomal protein S10 n=1 Tax=Jakoba bahamiensis TaxID=221721 RepID=M4QL25_9EUKA|nr:ribosomal protein S10 [Jakoba bahamiensis]AGH24153.1 ribosomal protein S10 [Jakoba bahamiensis]